VESKSEMIDALESRLCNLAYYWRGKHSTGAYEAASKIVDEYHATMAELWSLGGHGEGLTPDEELPDELMPDYWLEWWGRK
jgi:hypothetical protein